MKKLIGFVLMLALLLSSCAVSEIPETIEKEEETTIEEYVANNDVFGVAFAPSESADPYTTPNKLNAELMGLVCEPLFSLSQSFEVTPVLCSDYSYSDRTYVFKIRGGVTFSDGSALRASDVEYSLDCAMESGSYYAARLSLIESIKSSNRNGTVTVKLRYDNSRLPALLDIPIIKSGTRADMLPTGTGIYAPKDDLSSLIARKSHHSGKEPPYSVIKLYDVHSSDELVFEFDSHNVSILTGDPTGTSKSTPSSNSDRISVPTTQMHYLGFNLRDEALKDANVRVAIAKAIDRESAAQSDFALMGVAAALPIHPQSQLYLADTADVLSYDGQTQISVSKPLSILVNSENSGKLAVCKRIAETLTRLGTPTTVRALPFSEYTAALAKGDFTLYYGEVALGADFDITRLIAGSLNYGWIYDNGMSSALLSYLSGDEALADYCTYFCKYIPFAPIMFKNTVMYTEKNFFENAAPTSQNVYSGFCDWVLKK